MAAQRFQLHRRYSADQVAASIAGAREGHFIVGARRAACLARLRSPRPPRFPDRASFLWPRDVPDTVLGRPARELHLFVEREKGSFLYVGLAGARSYGTRGDGRGFEASFCFEPALPGPLWRELENWPLVPPPSGEPPEAEIARLAPSSTTARRVRALRVFFERWHGRPKAGAPLEPRLDVPRPLAEFHELVSKARSAVVCNQLAVVPEQTADRRRLLFYWENQGGYLWSTALRGADPPVWGRFDETGVPWRLEKERLSGFLIELALFEAIRGAPCGATAASLNPRARARLCSRLSPLPLGAWRWPEYPSRFYARDGALAFVTPYDGAFSVYVGARHPAALEFLEDLIDDEWECVAF